MRLGLTRLGLISLLACASTALGGWNAFVIRNSSTGSISPTINDVTVSGQAAKEFIVSLGGQKAGWGTSDLDGITLSEVLRLGVARLDDRTRFTAGTGPAVAPYLNFWITDGNGKFAVVANEPSNPDFQPLYNNGYNLTWADLANKPAKIYENSDMSWLPNIGFGNGVKLSFADLANFKIQAPTAAQLATNWAGLGTGAPRELGTNKAYGINWVFGDSLSNYVSGQPGYIVANPVAIAPADYFVSPATLAASRVLFSAPHGLGNNPFAYDWDSAKPEIAAGAPAGYGNSSFYASVLNNSTSTPVANVTDRYRSLRIGMRDLFGQNVTVGQIAKISYQTKKPAAQTAIDWRISIYTTPGDYATDPTNLSQGTGDAAKWYRNRLQNHPAGCLNLVAPAYQWNLWSTDAGTNQMLFSANRIDFTGENMSLVDLRGSLVTRGTSTWNFSGEEVMMIDFTLGANSGGGTGQSQMDAIQIQLTDGRLANLDLTAGTEWKVATVHGHDQFTISSDKSALTYAPQPVNAKGWYWNNNNGSPAGTPALNGANSSGLDPSAPRQGSRTFACTDVAVGRPLNSIKLVVEYDTNPTINFFITDGNGKFGIFAPTSGGLNSVAHKQLLTDGWTRATIDLTRSDIPDTASVAIYEHNGFTNVYGQPFTAMTWGDIKNYTIAGMYDYQRSPALGWDRWGTMFDKVNAAGSTSLVNGYGLALIWGDTVGNTAYATQSRRIRNVQVSFADVDYVGTFADAQVRDVLELNVPAPGLYLKPGDSITVDMDVKNLQQKVNGCQAILGYSSDFFNTGSVAAGGGDWDELIWQDWTIAGEINTAIGVDAKGSTGTDANGTIAKITLVAKDHEGTTQVVFLPDQSDVKATFLSAVGLPPQPIWPTKFNSTTIVIDDTPPVITCPADVTVGSGQLTDPPATGLATATDAYSPIAITYTDDRSGLTGCNSTGTIVRTWTATDPAGNVATCDQTITVIDNAAPVMTACPVNITQPTDPGQCQAVVSYTPPTATDLCYTEGFENEQFQSGAPWINGQGMPSISWNDYNSHVVRVPSGTDGIGSKGGIAHGIIDSTSLPGAPDDYSGAFSRMRGYSNSFGLGWKASVDAYIDLSDPAVVANTYGWDLSVAANTQSGGHLRDFIFHVASDDSAPGHVLVATSNNSNFQKRNDLDALNHYAVTTSGWYTFEWVFRDAAGVLAVDLNLLNADGSVLWTNTRSSATDLIGSVVGGNRYMWFTFLAVDKLAIDNTRLIRNVPVVCSPPSGSAFPKGTTTVTCTATDACNNAASCSFDVTVQDDEKPTIAIDSVKQGTKDLLASGAVALQGPVEITVSAADNCDLTNAPAVTVNGEEATLDTGAAGTWTYVFVVGSSTPNGPALIVASITDAADNDASDTASFNVNKNQITGQIELEDFVGSAREVTFVATGGVKKPWTLPLTFTGGIASYTLTDVPAGTTAISAKTAWSLREKQTVSLSATGQAVLDFVNGDGVRASWNPATDHYLRGGDINGTNSINILDYSTLKTSWGPNFKPAADVNGDGITGTVDYGIMQRNWFQVGDAE